MDNIKEKFSSRSNAIAMALITGGMAGLTNAIDNPPDDYMLYTFGGAVLVTMSRHIRDALIGFVSAKYNSGKEFSPNLLTPFNANEEGHAEDTRGE